MRIGAILAGLLLLTIGNAGPVALAQSGLTAISELIGRAMDAYESGHREPIRGLADVRAIDRWARDFAEARAGTVKSRV